MTTQQAQHMGPSRETSGLLGFCGATQQPLSENISRYCEMINTLKELVVIFFLCFKSELCESFTMKPLEI